MSHGLSYWQPHHPQEYRVTLTKPRCANPGSRQGGGYHDSAGLKLEMYLASSAAHGDQYCPHATNQKKKLRIALHSALFGPHLGVAGCVAGGSIGLNKPWNGNKSPGKPSASALELQEPAVICRVDLHLFRRRLLLPMQPICGFLAQVQVYSCLAALRPHMGGGGCATLHLQHRYVCTKFKTDGPRRVSSSENELGTPG